MNDAKAAALIAAVRELTEAVKVLTKISKEANDARPWVLTE